MISKKQRKSSRFYNRVIKASRRHRESHHTHLREMMANENRKFKMPSTMKYNEREMTLRPQVPREIRTQKQNVVLSFIPRVAKAFASLFRSKAAA